MVIFPRHDAPLGTDSGGEYFAAQLILREGCLRAEVSPNYDANDPGSWLLIWPNGFAFTTEPGTVRVVDELGRVVARVGDHVRLSRAALTLEQAAERELVRGVSEDCADPYFLVGDEVSAFDPRNEATELRLSDPDVVFFREKTKPKPRWDVHLPEVGDRAGSLAGGIRPLIAGPCGSGA